MQHRYGMGLQVKFIWILGMFTFLFAGIVVGGDKSGYFLPGSVSNLAIALLWVPIQVGYNFFTQGKQNTYE